jgi:DNA helicase-2/ATP-dependent DNA helicase PcrA
MPDYTPAQLDAIGCLDKPLQIIACAGSGKTQVISQRIASILDLDGVEPGNVIAFTFTDKAAAELKERVAHVAGHDRQGMAEMFIGTMHGYCLDLLQRLVPETFKFSVLSEITARLLVDRYSKQSGLTTCPTLPSAKQDVLRRYVNSKLFLEVTNVLREDGVNETKVPSGVLESLGDYLRLIYSKASFDFTELINLTVQFLESEDDDATRVQNHIRNNIRYVVVDEYQDVNPLQERLVRGLVKFGANLCVVGDDDQTIYQWRGSEVSNILRFIDRYDGVRQVTLGDNFRSSRGIVELAQSIAERIPAEQRLNKTMAAAGHQKWERGDILAVEYRTPEDEAIGICDRIESLRGTAFQDEPDSEPRGLSWADCAVLFRSVSKDAGPLVDEMKKRGIPFVIKGLNRLFETDELRAVVGIFAYVVGRITEDELEMRWHAADLIPDHGRWRNAVSVLDAGGDFDRGERWGVYNIQRLYLDFLEALELREENVPGADGRGELVFYQLGKFSQAISDFEQIHFSSDPRQKYTDFDGWLTYQAPDYYADTDADVGYASPDAVTISTVHQAKGMQWPAVFVPCLRRNRFPSQKHGGLGLFHVVPADAVRDADRYRGTLEDETRLFYVAATRAQKYLSLTFSPGHGRNHKRRSEFFDHCTAKQWVSTQPGADRTVESLPPHPRRETPQVTISFSELKYLFECPYQFKLRFLYGFNPPLHEALGYGKGVHDALAEIHRRAVAGESWQPSEAAELVQRHLHTPFAYPELRANLEQAAEAAINRYFAAHGKEIASSIHAEKPIQVRVAPGVLVDGRIDLIRRLDTNETSIVDFKSTERAQAEDVTRDQLHVYALGYNELTGESADLIEVLNLDEKGKNIREQVVPELLNDVRTRIRDAGDALRENNLPRLPKWCSQCESCDVAALCRARP